MPLRTCFISAPAGADLGTLRHALQRRGVHILVPQELAVGGDWASETQRQIARADLVIGVLPSTRQSPWVLFELGQASALGRRIVLITSPRADPIPFTAHQLLVLRIDLNNQDAIDFALDQILSAPERTRQSEPLHSPISPGLGPKADELLEKLATALGGADWQLLERVVEDAIRGSGADVVVPSQAPDIGADLAVWSDVLEPFVGNPFLIEIKARVKGRADATRVLGSLRSFIGASGSRWALLVYGEGPNADSPFWSAAPPNVLVLSAEALIENLRTRAFPELVRDLRNRRVHGASS